MNLEDVPNVIYRNSAGMVVVNPASPFLKDLDELPSVDHDMLDITKYSVTAEPRVQSAR